MAPRGNMAAISRPRRSRYEAAPPPLGSRTAASQTNQRSTDTPLQFWYPYKQARNLEVIM